MPSTVVLPVISCATSYGAGNGSHPFVARELPAAPTARGLTFYSNGLITVLGPPGWACGALVAADGGQDLAIYPPGKPDYSSSEAPKGAAVIQMAADYTGHLPGAEQVCALFPSSAAAADVMSGGLPCRVPARQKTAAFTPDILMFTDAPGVTGTGTGSGGALPSVGAAVYPQLPFASNASVDVSLISCTLPKKSASLCSAIVGDFLVRRPPVDTGSSSG